MAVPPRLPNLDPKDMQWVRWVADEITKLNSGHATIRANLNASNQQRATAQAATATQTQQSNDSIKIVIPTGPPQTPTVPILTTDHGTVTIRWDGLVHGVLPYTPGTGYDVGPTQLPSPGFNHVNVQRATSADGPFTVIGSNIAVAGSIVDANVVVGTTYWYQLVTTDNLNATSGPSTTASIAVQGVDLGSLNSDVTDAIQSAQSAADAGLAAGQAGQAAAEAAQSAADSSASQAATALQAAQDAQSTAQSALAQAEQASGGAASVVISSTTPDGASAVLWIDTTNNNNTPKRWDGTQWVALTDKAAIDAANAAVAAQNAADAAQATANTAVTNAQNAQTSANNALTAANGKNKVVYSATAATGTAGYISGDLWFQTDNTNKVIGQWQFNGTAWVAQTVSGSLVASGIDAGNITVGTLSAARIGANSIAASQMIAGTITAASGILADAVITTAKIADLAVNNAKIADLAVNNAKINDLNGNKITAASIVAGKFAAGAIVTNDIAAGAIDTNRLAAGAITADKISLGTNVPVGNTTDRVPQPLANNTFWASIISGVTKINANGGNTAYVASPAGITFPLTNGTVTSVLYMTATLTVPPSNKVSLSSAGNFTGSSGTGHIGIRWLNASGAVVATSTQETPGVNTYTAPTGSTNYDVYLEVKSPGTGGAIVSALRVFEVTGTSELGGQAAQLSPAGLQLFDANGQLAVDLTTNAQQYLSIVDNTQADPLTVASIDQMGNASFTEVSTSGGYDISGILLTNTDPTAGADSLFNAAPNGSTWDSSIPLLDRLARGPIYDTTWNNLNGKVVNTQYQRIAQDNFVLEDGRMYQFVTDLGGLATANATGQNIYIELQFKVGTPNASVTDGTSISHAVVYNGTSGYWALPPVIFAASANTSTLDTVNRLLPANVPIYWQINTNLSNTPSTPYTLAAFGLTRGFTVIDLGSSNLTRPNNGADTLANVTDLTTSGGSSGSTSGGTTATSKTVTFYAKSSRTWNNGGNTIVTGSGQYTNGASMYYGFGASDMGSWFGNFQTSGGSAMPTVLAGKTITAATLTVKNAYTYLSAGATVTFGTSSIHWPAPNTIGSPGGNTFSAAFSKGATKSMSLNSAIRSGLSSGSVKSFVLGVSGSTTNYSYFNGATQSSPPKIVVTYH